MTESAVTEIDRLRLLALCTIKGVNWNVLAREAQRPGGFTRLLAGEIAEDSRDGHATGRLLAPGLDSLSDRLERAQGEIDAAKQIGAQLVTVLDDEYPSNLRLITKLPPFLFYRGESRRDDARSVAVVGTRRASKQVSIAPESSPLAWCKREWPSSLVLREESTPQRIGQF